MEILEPVQGREKCDPQEFRDMHACEVEFMAMNNGQRNFMEGKEVSGEDALLTEMGGGEIAQNVHDKGQRKKRRSEVQAPCTTPVCSVWQMRVLPKSHIGGDVAEEDSG